MLGISGLRSFDKYKKTTQKMNSFNMKIFRFFNKLADYFWKKALQQQKRKVYHGTNTEAKKLPKGLQEAILKSQKKR